MLVKQLKSEIEVAQAIRSLPKERGYTVLDIETVSKTEDPKDAKNPHKARPVDVQILGRDDNEVFIFSAEFARPLLRLSPQMRLVGQNFKYDLICLAKAGINLTGYRWHDTMLLDALVDENATSHSLDSIVTRLYGKVGYKDDFWDKYESYLDAPVEERLKYGAADIYWTNLVYKKLMEKLNDRFS